MDGLKRWQCFYNCRIIMKKYESERRRERRAGVGTDVLVQVETPRFWGLIGPRVENYGWLLNISSRGAAIAYVDDRMRPNRPVRINIRPADGYYAVSDILVKTVSDFKLSDLESTKALRQRSFQFSDLSSGQSQQLANLIRWVETRK